jgi:hypothetical protein
MRKWGNLIVRHDSYMRSQLIPDAQYVCLFVGSTKNRCGSEKITRTNKRRNCKDYNNNDPDIDSISERSPSEGSFKEDNEKVITEPSDDSGQTILSKSGHHPTSHPSHSETATI